MQFLMEQDLWLLIFVCHVIAFQFSEGGFQYDDDYEEAASGGHRIVGARSHDVREIPFLVGLSLQGWDSTGCTGSLISPKWVLTAAHCTDKLNERQPGFKRRKSSCLKETVNNGHWKNGWSKMACKKLDDNGIEFKMISPKAYAWIHLKNINNWKEKKEAEKIEIKRIIRHPHSYQGGGEYGRFGGYDISLLELESETKAKFACLAGPNFNDNVISAISGYGRYLRNNGRTCQTDGGGPMKYHYCGREGAGTDICHKNREPPRSPTCKDFFQNSTLEYEHNSDKDIIIVRRNNRGALKTINQCYRSSHKQWGWCRTSGNYYDLENPRSRSNGWGYCSRDCYLNTRANENLAEEISKGDVGVLRTKENVHVLSDSLCNEFLEWSFDKVTPKVRPKILCVGNQVEFTADVYEKRADGGYEYLGDDLRQLGVRHEKDVKGKGFYVMSGGTCMGDSGGPVYVKEESTGRFIVTGVVSGGRGTLGRCGGINNPVHYVRVKKFATWIVQYIKTSGCWDEEFVLKLQQYKEMKKMKRTKTRTEGPSEKPY